MEPNNQFTQNPQQSTTDLDEEIELEEDNIDYPPPPLEFERRLVYFNLSSI